MTESYDNPNKLCSRCGKGYKRGFFELCPHCGHPTGERLSGASAEPKPLKPSKPSIISKFVRRRKK